jgi:hypothetical protein
MDQPCYFLIQTQGAIKEEACLTSHTKRLVSEAKDFSVVFAFDQAFSQADQADLRLQKKLNRMTELGCAGFFYASHAHFLFVSSERARLEQLRRN